MAWRALRAAEGQRTTVIDLYELVARRRGLAAHELPRAERLALARSVLAQVWPGFGVTEGSERPVEEVEVVPYDPAWPDRFAAWRDRLVGALGATALRIEHVGSTAVPGLAAKPVVDIQVSVADLEDESAYVRAVEGTGLRLRSRDDAHRFFRPPAERPRDVHVHVCAAGSEWERDHVLFRDLLRGDPRARAAYARAKQEARIRWADDRYAYTDAKTEVILRLLADAQE